MTPLLSWFCLLPVVFLLAGLTQSKDTQDLAIYKQSGTIHVPSKLNVANAYLWYGKSIFDMPNSIGMMNQYGIHGDDRNLRVATYLLGTKGILVLGIPEVAMSNAGRATGHANTDVETHSEKVHFSQRPVHPLVLKNVEKIEVSVDVDERSSKEPQLTTESKTPQWTPTPGRSEKVQLVKLLLGAKSKIGDILDAGAAGVRRDRMLGPLAFQALGEGLLQGRLGIPDEKASAWTSNFRNSSDPINIPPRALVVQMKPAKKSAREKTEDIIEIILGNRLLYSWSKVTHTVFRQQDSPSSKPEGSTKWRWRSEDRANSSKRPNDDATQDEPSKRLNCDETQAGPSKREHSSQDDESLGQPSGLRSRVFRDWRDESDWTELDENNEHEFAVDADDEEDDNEDGDDSD